MTSAAHLDRSDRLRLEFTGTQAGATLNGLLTNDVAKLAPGHGLYAAALTAKGKVIADLRVFAREDGFLVDASAPAAPGLVTMLKKYVNPRLAKYRDVSAETGTIGVFGALAAKIVSIATGASEVAISALSPYSHMAAGDALIARVPDLGGDGFDLFVRRAAVADWAAKIAAAGAAPMDDATAHLRRIEAGRTLWGTDMDENTLAQEAALDRADLNAISFDKGCYTGQETVARVHFRGHVNRILRGIRADASLVSGATVHAADGAQVGDVRSVARSPRFGWIALAYVRREIADGSALTVRAPGGEVSATVVPLPFA